MQSQLNHVAWLAVAIALLGTPRPVHAQAAACDDSVDALNRQQPASVRVPDSILDDRAVAEPSARDHHDTLFHALSATFLIAASIDLSTSMYHIGQGTAREVGFGAAWQDNPVAFAATKTAIAAGFAYGLQRVHKTRPKTALVLGIAATAAEGWLAVRTARMTP